MITQHAYSPATEATKKGIVEIEDQHRSSLYVLLSSLLSGPPSADLLSKVNTLSGGDNKIGEAVKTLNILSKKLGIKTIEREYNNLFIGVGRGELLPYASFYMTAFLNEKPLANLRDDMKRIGISRSPSTSDPEARMKAPDTLMHERGLFPGAVANLASLGVYKRLCESR